MTNAPIRKPAHGTCLGHRFFKQGSATRSIGKVELWLCTDCLTVKVVQQKVGHTIEKAIETIVELADSAYPA